MNTAAVEIDDAVFIETGKDNAVVESILHPANDDAPLPEQLDGISQSGQMLPQQSSRSIPDLQLLDNPGILQASAAQIGASICVEVELAPVETDGFPKDLVATGLRRSEFLIQMNEGFRE